MSTIEKTLRYIVLTGVFALPFVVFIVINDYFFPFITGKNFAFRLIVEIIGGAYLALAIVRPEYRPRKSPLLLAFAVFVALIAVADAFGAHPFKSFWSNFERMDGWITLAHLLAYVTVASSVINTEKLWRAFWSTSLAVSVLVALYGFLQLAGGAALGQRGATGLAARLDATFGNPIYLAAFMLFNIFIAALLWAQDRTERGTALRSGRSLLLWGVIALDAFVLFFTGTRGTMLGLIGGAVLTVLILAFLQKDAFIRRLAIVSIIVVVLAAAGLRLARDSAFVRSVGSLERLATISLSDPTVKARFLNMGIAWQGVKERPLLGWGQENYAIVFDKYYDPRMYAQEQWFDRVHNSIFDWLVAGGFLGLISYLSIFVVALWLIWRGTGNSADAKNKRAGPWGPFSTMEKAMLTGLLVGYFFHNLFAFDNITSYILFASIIAYVVSRDSAARGVPPLFQNSPLSPTMLAPVAALAVPLVWLAAWGLSGTAYAQNKTILQALAPHPEGISKNLELFEEAIAYQSFGTQEAREQLTQAAISIAQNKDISSDIKQRYYEAGVREMKAQAAVSPLDARFPLFEGILQGAYGDAAAAEDALRRALELSPKKQTILFELASNAMVRGDEAAALAYFKQAFELEPAFSMARVYYAASLIRSGNDKEAEAILTPLMESGAAATPHITGAYVSRGRYDKVVTIWRARVAAHPEDTQARFTLSAALYATGNVREAIAQLEEAGRIDPAAKEQAAAFIEQMRAGTANVIP